jgi:hypothetical protein
MVLGQREHCALGQPSLPLSSYKPEGIVNPIDLRFNKNKMFLKRPDGKDLEVVVIKREHPDARAKFQDEWMNPQ